MSADIMPCGCEGHADNEDLCQYPALEAKYKAAVKREAKMRRALEAFQRSITFNVDPSKGMVGAWFFSPGYVREGETEPSLGAEALKKLLDAALSPGAAQ